VTRGQQQCAVGIYQTAPPLTRAVYIDVCGTGHRDAGTASSGLLRVVRQRGPQRTTETGENPLPDCGADITRNWDQSSSARPVSVACSINPAATSRSQRVEAGG
jgi:hypothetical protein